VDAIQRLKPDDCYNEYKRMMLRWFLSLSLSVLTAIFQEGLG